MIRMLVTCPETAHLEEIDYDEHPLGRLILGCSRFGSRCPLMCPRTCAARLDRRENDRTNPMIGTDDTTVVRSR
jgi:hypothetical protein